MKNKLKAFLSFFLSLIIVFTVTPATVFAADFSTNQFWVLENGPDSNYIDKSFNGSCNVYSSAKWSTINSFIIYPNYINKMGSNPMYLDSGDVINCSFNIDVSEMSSGTYFVDYDYYASSDLSDMEFGDILDTRPLGNGNISFSFTVEQSGYYVISVNIKPNNKSASSFGHLKISDFKIESESENTSLLKRIVSFFKELFNHLSSGLESIGSWFSDLGSNIGSWFSDLGDKIGNFFSNLISNIQEQFTKMINNLKDFFSDVGQWFQDIGDRIGEFFSNLWENISGKFEEFGNKISSWWQSVVDFFHSLFVPEAGYFDTYKANWETFIQNHFGMLYQSIEIVENVFNYLSTLGANDYSFTVPEIRLPFFNNPVIVPTTSFNFNSIISQHSQIKFVYNTFQTMVTFICFIGLAMFAKKTFEDIIGER